MDLNYDDAISLEELQKCILSFLEYDNRTSYNEETSTMHRTRASETLSAVMSPSKKTS